VASAQGIAIPAVSCAASSAPENHRPSGQGPNRNSEPTDRAALPSSPSLGTGRDAIPFSALLPKPPAGFSPPRGSWRGQPQRQRALGVRRLGSEKGGFDGDGERPDAGDLGRGQELAVPEHFHKMPRQANHFTLESGTGVFSPDLGFLKRTDRARSQTLDVVQFTPHRLRHLEKRAGGFHPMVSDLHPPALDVRPARAISSRWSSQSVNRCDPPWSGAAGA